MTLAGSIDGSGTRGSIVEKLVEWIAVTFGVAVVVFVSACLLTGPAIGYDAHYNHMLVWSAAAGAAGLSAWHAWLLHNRGTRSGGVWSIPGSAPAVWALATGAVLWLAAMLIDKSRLNPIGLGDDEFVVRAPVEQGMWVPLAAVATLSLLYARRRGVLRWAVASLPLQALWWWATLSAAT